MSSEPTESMASGKREIAALERRRLEKLRSHEQLLEQVGIGPVAGVDEVGMGPLAGPVVAAAVILPGDPLIEDLDDSKSMTRPARERVAWEPELLEMHVQGLPRAQPLEVAAREYQADDLLETGVSCLGSVGY